MITAIVFVKADVARIPEVAESIAALEGISEVYSVTGQIDLIAMVRVRNHEDVASVVADRLNKVPGVTSTETHIAFRAYSRHDLESAFSLGLDLAPPERPPALGSGHEEDADVTARDERRTAGATPPGRA